MKKGFVEGGIEATTAAKMSLRSLVSGKKQIKYKIDGPIINNSFIQIAITIVTVKK